MLNATPPSPILTILQPAIDALDSVGLESRCALLRRAVTRREAFAALEAASDALFDICDLDRRLRNNGRPNLSQQDFEKLDAAHDVVLTALGAAAHMPVAEDLVAAGRAEQPPAGAEDRAVAAACGGAR